MRNTAAVRCLTGLLAGALVAVAAPLRAQPPGVAIVTPVAAGDCAVVVRFAGGAPAAGTLVELRLNGPGAIPRVPADGRETFPLALKGPLVAGDTLTAVAWTGDTPGTPSAAVSVAASTAAPQCDPPAPLQVDDDREALQVTAYVGQAFDNFAPGKVGGYRDGTASSQRSRFIAGMNFEFRVLGTPADRLQFWLAGETLHGVRSADVDCTAEPKPAICGNGSDTDRFIATLRGATSLEAYVAPRLEFATLQRGSGFAGKLYVTGRLGVMALEDAPHSFSTHHVGGGITTTVGPFTGSYLEAGWGRTDLFLPEFGAERGRWNRLKIDALVSFPLLSAFMDRAKDWKRAPRLFVQLYSDFDIGDTAADSLQTFVGLDFDLSGIVR